MFDCILCDPDTREREGTALGLFYTALSRATTLGNHNGEESAIYFDGDDFTEERIRNIGRHKDSEEDYKRVKKRARWVHYLIKHKYTSSLTHPQIKNILKWAESTNYDYLDLLDRTNHYNACRK